jgi:hypothetical protein
VPLFQMADKEDATHPRRLSFWVIAFGVTAFGFGPAFTSAQDGATVGTMTKSENVGTGRQTRFLQLRRWAPAGAGQIVKIDVTKPTAS